MMKKKKEKKKEEVKNKKKGEPRSGRERQDLGFRVWKRGKWW